SVTGRDQRDVFFGDAEVGPSEAERVENLGGQYVANVFTGRGIHDLAHQRAPGQGVVDVHQPRPIERSQLAELFLRILVVIRAAKVWPGAGGERDARAVGQHVADRGAVFAVAGVAGDVFANPVI